MKNFLQIISNPFLLPLVPAVLIFMMLPINCDRYVLHIIDKRDVGERRHVHHADITNDGYSERIVTGQEETYTWLKIYDHNGVLFDQWNFRGAQEHIDFPGGPSGTVGLHGDNRNSIVVFTLVQDSLYLHVIDNLHNPVPRLENRFIARVGPGRGRPDPLIRPPKAGDVFQDGYSDLLFLVSSRFSLYPRRVFAYSMHRDSLLVSPESFYSLRWFEKADMTGNRSNEFLLSGSSVANVTPNKHQLHDHSNWIMMLDHELNYVFDPIEVPGPAKRLITFPYETDQQMRIGTLLFRHNLNKPALLSFYDTRGQLQRKKELDKPFSLGFKLPEADTQKLVMNEQNGKTYLYDLDKQKITIEHPVPANSNYSLKDLTGNGAKELISTDSSTNSLIVFRNQMRHYAMLQDEISMDGQEVVSFIKSPLHHPLISLQAGHTSYTISYGRNPHYYLSFVYFSGIYIGFFLFGMMTRYYQQNNLARKAAIEKKITELQLTLIKNQLNPHFSLNAINAAIHTIKNEETEKAADYLRRFSRLHRAMVLSAEQMHRSLAAEIQFTSDYIELEKLRFDHAFEADIIVSDGVDQEVRLPKMILQSYAENAIKHGLAAKEGGGLLRICIDQHHEKITIRITDNGVGRKMASGIDHSSTGRGHDMMNEYYTLYNKYYPVQIKHEIEDCYDEQGDPAGTTVKIVASLNSS